MYTLHIEHHISDFGIWLAAFDRFAGMRSAAGVRTHTIKRPVDDRNYVSIDLDFDTPDSAEAFLKVLRSRVWSTPDNSPALVGDPTTRILVTEQSD